MTDYTVADPAQDTVSFSLASVMNQANQANVDALLENNFHVDSLILAFFPWITSLPMVSTLLSELYPANYFAHVHLLTPLLFLFVIEYMTAIGNHP